MSLHELKPAEGSTKRIKRIGRGIGSGKGKTSTRGHKGQKAKRNLPPGFEGGQTPLHRRLPVKKGFRNPNHKTFAIINLDDLENNFDAGADVTPEMLLEKRLIKKIEDGLKVLAFGEITKKMTVNAHKFSKKAAEAITAAGGEAKTL
jgi:large subunit ribosomal protein L15